MKALFCDEASFHKEVRKRYNSECSRYESFIAIPLTHLEILWYTKQGYANHIFGFVQCVFCEATHEEIFRSKERFTPMHTVSCPKINNSQCDDVPMTDEQIQIVKAKRQTYIKDKRDFIEVIARDAREEVRGIKNKHTLDMIRIYNMSTFANVNYEIREGRLLYNRLRHSRAWYRHFENYEARLKTFKTWPIALTQTKTQMAKAGFFYSNCGDKVECYHCKLVHDGWRKNDIPKVIHARLSGSRCYFAQIQWGKRFIDAVSSSIFYFGLYIKFCVFIVFQCRESTDNQSPTQFLPKKTASAVAPRKTSLNASSSAAAAAAAAVVADDRNVNLLCKICLVAELTILFYPCCHLMSCVDCCLKISHCPVCREVIVDTIRAVIS